MTEKRDIFTFASMGKKKSWVHRKLQIKSVGMFNAILTIAFDSYERMAARAYEIF